MKKNQALSFQLFDWIHIAITVQMFVTFISQDVRLDRQRQHRPGSTVDVDRP